MYYFHTAPALSYRWPTRYRFLIIETVLFYILVFVESESEVRLYQELLKEGKRTLINKGKRQGTQKNAMAEVKR